MLHLLDRYGREELDAAIAEATQRGAFAAEAVAHLLEQRQRGVALVLSGHTHVGQLWPFGALVRLQQPVVAGLHRIGETWLYVSCGTGYWGLPMRLGAPAEVTLLTLRSE